MLLIEAIKLLEAKQHTLINVVHNCKGTGRLGDLYIKEWKTYLIFAVHIILLLYIIIYD